MYQQKETIMKAILNINLTDSQYNNLVAKVMHNTRRAWEADEKGDHANGILSGIGKVSCQLLYIIYRDDKTLGLALSPETISAINFVNLCVPVSIEDCVSFISKFIPETINVLGETLTKADAEVIFENLTDEFDDLKLDIATGGEIDMSEASSHCLLMKAFMDAGVGKLQTASELLVRLFAESGDEDEARIILKFSM